MRRITDIDLRQIMTFRAIVECQGMAGARLVLNLSQSRISARLAELEARMGARLCRRGRSGFALTEAGEELYAASHALVEAVDQFCIRTSDVAPNVRKMVRIGTVDAMVGNPDLSLPGAIASLVAQWPSLLVDLAIAEPEELERSLMDGRRDIIVTPSINRKAGLDYTPLFQEHQSLYCGKTHPLFAQPDDLISDACLARQAFVARRYLHHEDLKRIGHWEPGAMVEMMEAQLILVLSGAFVGYLPRHYANAWCARGELRAIQDERRSYHSCFYIVTPRGSMDNPLLRYLHAVLVKSTEGFARQDPCPGALGVGSCP